MSRAGILAKAVASFCLYTGLASCSYEANSPTLNTDGGGLAPGVPQIMDVTSSPITGGSSMLTITGKNLQKASFVINNSTQPISAPVNAQDTQVMLSVDEKILNADPIVGVAGVASVYAFSASGTGPIKKFNYYQSINSISFTSTDSHPELGVSGFIDQDNNIDRVAAGFGTKAAHIYVTVSGRAQQQDISLTSNGAQVLWILLADMDGDRLVDLVFTYQDSTSALAKLGVYRNNTASTSSGNAYFDSSVNLIGSYDTQLAIPSGGTASIVVSDVNRNGVPDITLLVGNNTSVATKTFFR